MKKYKLLKDLPTFMAGDMFELRDDGCLYLSEQCGVGDHWKPAKKIMAYHKNTLAHFPNILEEWFEEIGQPEPKEFYLIDGIGGVSAVNADWELAYEPETIGNCFETREEAEKAVEKLKAWKRLRDKGFRFKLWVRTTDNFSDTIKIAATSPTVTCSDELDLLFGGEK